GYAEGAGFTAARLLGGHTALAAAAAVALPAAALAVGCLTAACWLPQARGAAGALACAAGLLRLARTTRTGASPPGPPYRRFAAPSRLVLKRRTG
ncbi:hypothetical protein, partial [Streptomyces aurantiacus]|uniref:hypothetical protein n=1 Tax=Streptomyces aurantiacus TaxID=47760 RepID=UPI000562230E